jgi:hypothetical protein
MPCGPKFNRVIADDSYASSVAAATAQADVDAATSVMQPVLESEDDDIDQRLSAAAIRAEKLILKQRSQENPGNSSFFSDYNDYFGDIQTRIDAASARSAALDSAIESLESGNSQAQRREQVMRPVSGVSVVDWGQVK